MLIKVVAEISRDDEVIGDTYGLLIGEFLRVRSQLCLKPGGHIRLAVAVINPFNASCSKWLLFEEFSAILV